MERQVLNTQSGFTLVEIVVVVAIIALLAGITIPLVADRDDDAKVATATSDVDVIAKALVAYKLDTGFWPYGSSNRAPSAMPTASLSFASYYRLFEEANVKGWKGPYLNEPAVINGRMRAAYRSGTQREGYLDPWGNYYHIYQYAMSGTDRGFLAVVCRGPDGALSTTQTEAFNGQTSGDDIMKIVTRKL